MRKLLTLVICSCLFAISASAQETATIGGLTYTLATDGTASVASYQSATLEGVITVPATIAYNGKTYNVTALANYCFTNCSSLTNITLPNSITRIGYCCFVNCSNLTSATLPNGITTLEDYTFYKCSSLSSITLPNSITKIGFGCFFNCSSLTSITLPSSIISLGFSTISDREYYVNTECGGTFWGCNSLSKVTCQWNNLDNISIREGIFSDTLPEAILYVPKGTVDLYKKTSPWSGFGQVLEQPVTYDAVLLTNDTTVYKGTQVRLPIYLKNKVNITAFQTDIYLPSGVTIAKNDKGKSMIELSDRKDDQVIAFNMQTSGAMRVVAYSATSSAFSGNAGPLFYVTLNVADTLSAGDYSIYIKNTKLSTPAAKEYSVDEMDSKLTVKDYMLGDVDGNKVITISDAVAIVNHLLNTGSTTFIEKAADVDGSNDITINDVVALVNKYILNTRAKANAPATRADAEDDYLYISDVNINAGETIDLAIKMHNADQITAFQTDIYLPDGISVAKNSKGKNDMTLSSRADDQVIASNIQTDGAMRVVAYSMSSAPFSENDGTLFTMKITAAKDIKAGTDIIKIANTELSTPAAKAIRPEARTSSINITAATGINPVEAAANETNSKIYTLDGRLLNSPVKGINIIKMSDGTTKKIVVK
jgi:hypothetical protein